jgi:hypothetical protein
MTVAAGLVRLIAVVIVAAGLPCRAEDAMSGRWEGTARIPDDELNVIVRGKTARGSDRSSSPGSE